MRKLTPRYKRWLLHKARKSRCLKRKNRTLRKPIRGALQVEAWLGETSETVISQFPPMVPPAHLCLTDNPEATLKFLSAVRNDLNLKDAASSPGKYVWLKRAKTPKGLRRMRSYADFSAIEAISTSTALIMTAEYHRAANIMGSAPPAIDLHKWSDGSFLPLFQIGFFEAIGPLTDQSPDLLDKGPIVHLRAVSGRDGTDLEAVSKSLAELVHMLEGKELPREFRLNLNNAIGEAMVNVSKWAYPHDYDFHEPHLSNFWVTASVDRVNNLLTVVIYDHGVTIPVSYPRKRLKQQALDYLASLMGADSEFEFENDSAYIDCAMKFGNSRSGKEYRGQGLPQMKELIDNVGGGSLTICSRGGVWRYEFDRPLERSSFAYSVGGTLIEWKIQVPEGGTDD